jgi:hypothetical protein
MGWEPLKVPGVSPAVLEAEDRRMQDYIVGWVQGLSAHIDKVDAAKGLKQARRKVTKAPTSSPGSRKRQR